MCQMYHKDQMLEDLRPTGQIGVAVPNGCKIIYHAVRTSLDFHPDWAVLSVDVANAYNCLSRTAMFDTLRDSRMMG